MTEAPTATSLHAYVPQLVIDWLEAGGDAACADVQIVEGTIVFADVSGFTPLSERLARKGRVGSEELTDILNKLFGRLLDVASAYGGDLLKYGGDALLLFFRDDGHASRAAVAAATMQRVLREESRIDTGSGIVRLRMSVGVHSGDVLFTLVGETHRELLLTGPAVTTTVRMEAAADAGEVLVSAETASQLERAWLGGDKEGGRLLRLPRVDGALPMQPFTRRLSDVAHLAVPDALRDHLSLGVTEGEHRQATLAFAQFKGTDGLLASNGAAAVAAELHAVMVGCQRAAAQHDVTLLATDIDADGGKVLFATGAPRAGANDSDRMLHAMLQVAGLPTRLSLRVGVNRGHAFAVDVGAPYRRTYAVMGDPTNLAARVMGKSAPGGVLATAAVIDDLRGAFELAPREPFMVKGKSNAIVAFDVGEPLGAQRESTGDAVPVIGHDRARAGIDRAVEEVLQGLGTAMAIVGGPGMGKSRLVAHLLAAAGDRPVVLFEGGQYAAHTPLFALRPALRAILGATLADDPATIIERLRDLVDRLAPHLTPWLALLNDPFGIDIEESPEVAAIETRFRRSRVAAMVVDLLDHVLPKPSIIVIEDAHWLDDSSVDVLRDVVDAATDRAWVVCVTSRDPKALYLDSSTTVRVHHLEPLTDEESRELLYHLLGDDPLPPLIVAAIAERGAGNPLFLAELLDAVRAGQGIDAMPHSLEAVIAARIDALDPERRSLLRSASVLGARFPLRALARMLETDEAHVRTALDGLDAFLTTDGAEGRRFRTALLRQVAYETLPFRRRRELHGRAATVLEAVADAGGERPVALLSLHFHAAEQYESAWRYAREAADLAASSHAAVEATALYQRAIDAARRLRAVGDEELARVWVAHGEQSEYAGRTDDAVESFARARALARHDDLALAGVMLKDGWLRERSKHYAQALRWYSLALRALEGVPARSEPDGASDRDAGTRTRLHAEIQVAYGAVRLRQGRYKDGLRRLQEAATEAEAIGADDVLAHAYYLLDWALTDLGRAAEAQRYRELALPIYERLGDLSGQANVLNNLGIDAYYEGRWDEALALYERSRRARERSGDVVQLGLAANNIGEILSDQGALAGAETLFRDALRVWRGSNFRIGDGVATSNLGRVATRSGRYDEARALFAEAARIFDSIGAASFRADVDAREAERLLFAGAPAHALLLADDVCARFERSGTATPAVITMAHRIAACALAHLGRFDEGLRRLDHATEVAEGASAEYELALALEARAHILSLRSDVNAEPYAIAAAALLDRLGVESTPLSRIGRLAHADATR